MINNLISSIGRQLNIAETPDTEWICQIIYSIAGKMALASLGDHVQGEHGVSIQHFKQRASHIIDAYVSLYPQVRHMFFSDNHALEDEIYSIYLRSGYFYHTSHHLSPAIPTIAGNNNVVLHRGVFPDVPYFMSGLGYYSSENVAAVQSPSAVFGLQTQIFKSYLEELLTANEWEQIEWPDSSEFLLLDPPFTRGYWQHTPHRDGRISLARYGAPNRLYVFYRYRDGIYEYKPIPEWRVRDLRKTDGLDHSEYRRIAIALLNEYKTLPEIKVTFEHSYVKIKLGYRLPPSEEDFLKLLSWPIRYNFTAPQFFTRKMASAVYPLFKAQLEPIGYHFTEESS